MDVVLLLLGLALILGGANFLTDGAAALAQRFRVPEFVIGLTIVAVGTSAPELVVSALSAAAGKSDVAIGNVVGSNLFNLFVIVGLCALVRPLALTRENIRRDIPFGMLGSLLLFAVTSDRLLHLGTEDRIGRAEGMVMLLLYVAFVGYTVRQAGRDGRADGGSGRSGAGANADAVPEAGAKMRLKKRMKRSPDEASGREARSRMRLGVAALCILGGLGGLIFGGELFLDSATRIARQLGVSERVIAITLVAGGTSLPELASSLVSLAKGRAAMALGNVLGSNIANILLILGLGAAIRPLSMGGMAPADILMVVASSLLLFATAFTFRRRVVDRAEGLIFLAIYAAYIWYLIAK